MKKYNKPEIVTLALDMVDVIETSSTGVKMAADALNTAGVKVANIASIETQLNEMENTWSW